MEETVEKKVGSAMLQEPHRVKVGKREYRVASPTIGTLIMASEAIAELPSMGIDGVGGVFEALAKAKDCRPMGDAMAAFILGSRHAGDRVWSWRKCKFMSKRDKLAKYILDNMPISDLSILAAGLLGKFGLADFFAFTTFLTGTNLTRATKVV